VGGFAPRTRPRLTRVFSGLEAKTRMGIVTTMAISRLLLKHSWRIELPPPTQHSTCVGLWERPMGAFAWFGAIPTTLIEFASNAG
jgi:hypothetical protein